MTEEALSLHASILHITFKTLLEAAQAATAVNQVLLATGPGRVRRRVDVQGQLLAGFAPCRAGFVARAVVQHDSYEMIFGVDALFHGTAFHAETGGQFEAAAYKG